jgi:WD40 repeat protein
MLYKNDNENFAVLYKNGIKIYSLNIKKKTFDEVNNLTIKNEINIKTNNNKIIYNNVMECLPKKKIAFSNIYTISIWDYDNKDNNNNLITLEGHTKSVTSLLLLKDEKLLSGSEDKKIYLWNIEKKFVLKELNGHKGAVLSMYQINEGNLISGDQYCLIYIWSLDLNEIIQKIVAQGSIIKIEQLKNRDLVTYSSDNEIKIWGYID